MDLSKYRVTLVGGQQLESTAESLKLDCIIRIDDGVVGGLRDTPLTRAERDAVLEKGTDVFWRLADAPAPKLFLADMDATMVMEETIDELAKKFGVGAAVQAITDRAKTGQLEFKEALRQRVAMFKGMPESLLAETAAEIRLMTGAETLMTALRANNVTTILISGGFIYFTGSVGARLGFTHHFSNAFEIVDGHLTGRVMGDILDRAAKRTTLERFMTELGCTRDEVIAIGDGANDLDMLQGAGFGVGYQPKPIVRDTMDQLIVHGDLSTLRYPLGNSFLNL